MKTLSVVLLVLMSVAAFAQDGDKLVTVPQKYVSAEGLQHQSGEPTGELGTWANWGKEIGVATREALTAVVDQSERFGATKVGTFVMVMVAWRIMGKDLMGFVIGVPMLITVLCLWVWTVKRLFFGYKAVDTRTGWLGLQKTYKLIPPYKFSGDEARAFTAIAVIAGLGGGIAASLLIMF